MNTTTLQPCAAHHAARPHPARVKAALFGALLGLSSLGVQGQTPPAAKSTAPAASAPLNKNVPGPHTPAEVRDSATAPGDLRPENPVVPQISIPLGRGERTPVLSKEEQARKARASQQAAGGETAASCLAKVRAEEREACLSRVPRATGQTPKTP